MASGDLTYMCGCPECCALRAALGTDAAAFGLGGATDVFERPGVPGWPLPRDVGGAGGIIVPDDPGSGGPNPPPRPDTPGVFGPLVANEDFFRWNLGNAIGTPVQLTFSFMQSLAPYLPISDWQGFQPFNASQMAGAQDVLGLYAQVAGFTFVPVDDGGNGGQIRFGNFVNDPALIAFAYYGGTYGPIAGDVGLNSAVPENLDPVAGDIGHFALIHELGHAFGLKHPFEAPFLPASQDNHQYTVMSYTNHPNSTFYSVQGTAVTTFTVYPRTPMLLDVAAIQYLYGANGTARPGDTLYRYQTNEVFIETIWDGGGTDTIDFSNQVRNGTINLGSGAFSSLGPDTLAGLPPEVVAQLQGRTDLYGVNNLSIAFGTVIENARGGSGNDRITGNAVANDISGGGGQDTLTGGDGDDTLAGALGDDQIEGGPGSDTAAFQAQAAAYQIVNANGVVTVSLPLVDGTDRLTGVELLRFVDRTISVDSIPTNPVSITVDFVAEGDSGTTALTFTVRQGAVTGTATAITYATLDGTALAGQDYVAVANGTVTIPAGATSATFTVQVIGDTIVEDNETFTVQLTGATGATGVGIGFQDSATATILDDELGAPIAITGMAIGPTSTNAFLGGAFLSAGFLSDWVVGGAGADTLFGLNSADIIEGRAGNDLLLGDLPGLGSDRLLGGEGADTAFGGGGADTIYGEAGDDFLIAEDGDDSVFGGPGNDVLFGGSGSDSLAGDDGTDFLFGDQGVDQLAGGAGNDRLHVDREDSLADGGAGVFDVLVLMDNAGGIAAIDLGAADQNATGAGPALAGFEAVDASLATAAVAIAGAAFNGFGNVLFGSGFADTITGSALADIILGNRGDDAVAGGDGADTIIADAGDDTLTGGAGPDEFFHTGGEQAGDVRIADFAPADDSVLLAAGLGFAGGAAAKAALVQSGADAVLSFAGGGSLTFVGVSASAIAAADFTIV